MKIKIVIVIFKKNLQESQTLLSLMEQNHLEGMGIKVEIYDNSPIPCLSIEEINILSKKYSLTYKESPENRPLSSIYEEVFKDYINYDYALLLDDDSHLPANYLSSFFRQEKNNRNNHVYVPKIFTYKKLLSPYFTYFIFSKPIQYKFTGRANRLTAINSGIFVPLTYKQSLFKYPKYCQFYGTDSVLFEYFHKQGVNVYVLEACVEHELSFHPDSHEDTYMKSLRKVVTFWQHHYKNSVIWNVILKAYLFLLSIKLSIRFRKIINLFKKAS